LLPLSLNPYNIKVKHIASQKRKVVDFKGQYKQQRQQSSFLFPSKLGRLEMKPHEQKKETKQERKRREKTKDDKKPNKKGDKAIKR
jgi:hypothetical protein